MRRGLRGVRLNGEGGYAELLREVEGMLGAFERRRDLRHHADALQDSGIAGTIEMSLTLRTAVSAPA